MSKTFTDPKDMKKAIYSFADNLRDAMDIGQQVSLTSTYTKIENVVVAGMGGSAIGGDVNRMLLRDELKVPIYVSRNYHVPSWANARTLVIASSYSGATEETLSAVADALKKGCQICGITTGGELKDVLQKNDFDRVLTPTGLQPRAALAYSFVPMLYLLLGVGLVDSDIVQKLKKTADLMESVRDNYSKAGDENETWSLAKSVHGTIPIIYGETESTAVVALRWRGQFSENGKMLAFHNELPELNHNEIIGWENNPELLNHLSIIWLKDKSDQERVSMRQDVTGTILENVTKNQYEVAVSGASRFERLLHLIHYGDWVSLWCAYLHDTDPSPVENISNLKDQLSRK
jgi:glucose/mannose-6-phosphate isomerase